MRYRIKLPECTTSTGTS